MMLLMLAGVAFSFGLVGLLVGLTIGHTQGVITCEIAVQEAVELGGSYKQKIQHVKEAVNYV